MNDDTPHHFSMQLNRVMARVLRDDFQSFLEKCFVTLHPNQGFIPNWHLSLVAEYLEACRQGEITRLILNLPPRSLKSFMVSVAWPAFVMGHEPAQKILSASYAQPLATRHAMDSRKILRSKWYQRLFPHTRLTREQCQKHRYATTAHGHRIATSIGGSITGEGGNILLVDDPQHPLQTTSSAMRQRTAQWFDQAFASRLDDKRKGSIIVVMQRLHEEDLSGHLLAKGGWEHLSLPAIATVTRYFQQGSVSYQRQQGEPLHPGREDEALLARARKELGEHGFMAQYQQQPLPQAGRMMKREWLRYYSALPEAPPARIVQSWDTAIKTGAEHDASACLTIAEIGNDIYVLDCYAGRLDYPSLRRTMLEHAAKWRADVVLIEDKASGQSLLQDLRGEMVVPCIGIMPKQDKITRFATVTTLLEAGQIHLPARRTGIAEFEAELLAFPDGNHDDRVDALSQYVIWRRSRVTLEPSMRSL